jgi:hypothetical protein
MERKSSERSDVLVSVFAVALVAATMGLGAALATKSDADLIPAGTQAELRGSTGTDPGIAADAQPDDVQTFY